jgi:hypothetical protein
VRLALMNDPVVLRQEIAELEYLEERITNTQDKTVMRETWQEYAGAWISLLQMRTQLQSVRAQAVLARIFEDREELKAIGAAKQMDGLQDGGHVPQVLLDLLKNKCAKPLQETIYELTRAIVREKQSISKIMRMQQQGVALLWTVIVATSIGLSNAMFPRIMKSYSDEWIAFVIFCIVMLALIAFVGTQLARHFAGQDLGVCAAIVQQIACVKCMPCTKKKNPGVENGEEDTTAAVDSEAGGGKEQEVQEEQEHVDKTDKILLEMEEKKKKRKHKRMLKRRDSNRTRSGRGEKEEKI